MTEAQIKVEWQVGLNDEEKCTFSKIKWYYAWW